MLVIVDCLYYGLLWLSYLMVYCYSFFAFVIVSVITLVVSMGWIWLVFPSFPGCLGFIVYLNVWVMFSIAFLVG